MSGGGGGGFAMPQSQYYGSALPQSQPQNYGAGVAGYTMPNFGGFNFGNYTGMNYVPNTAPTGTSSGTDPNTMQQYGHPPADLSGAWNWRYPFGGQFGFGGGPQGPTDQHTGDTTGTSLGNGTDTRTTTPGLTTPTVTAPTSPPVTPPNPNSPPVNPPSPPGNTLSTNPKSYDPASDGYAGGANQYQIRNGAAGMLSGVPQSALQAIQMMGQSNDPGAVLAAVGQQLGQQGMSQDTINQIVQQARGGAGQGIVQATQGMGQPNFAGSPYAQFFQQPTGWQPGQPFRQV